LSSLTAFRARLILIASWLIPGDSDLSPGIVLKRSTNPSSSIDNCRPASRIRPYRVLKYE
jgi:hypothetical protein